MAPFVFRCPVTGQHVQGWAAADNSEDVSGRYLTITCLACQRVHLIDPKTGKVSGANEE